MRPFINDNEVSLLAKACLPERDEVAYRNIRISPESVALMDKTIIDNTNSDVKENDTLYILGDFAFVKTHEQAKAYRDRINCKNVILIWGNHDNRELLKGLFQGYYDLLDINVKGQKITLTHYAMWTWDCSHRSSWNLFGHSHNMIHSLSGTFSCDVGVDAWDYHPVSFEQLKLFMSEKDINGPKGYFEVKGEK